MNIKTYIFLFVFLPNIALAQGNIDAKVSKKEVTLNESFTLVVQAEGNFNNFKEPANLYENFYVKGPDVVPGGYYDKMRNHLIVKNWTYQLKAKEEGTFTIRSASIKSGNEIIKTQPIRIKVISASQRKIDPNSQEGKARKFSSFKVLVNPKEAYLGQPINVTYKAFNQSDWNLTQGPTEPEYNGFIKEQLEFRQRERIEMIGGTKKRTFVFDKFLLFPQKVQDFSGGTVDLELVTGVPSNKTDRQGNHIMYGVNHVLNTKIPTITVKPFPPGAPGSFTGAVGTFSFAVRLSRNELNADESTTLTISVTGKGNTKLVALPEIKIPDDLETYDPKYAEKISLESYGYTGSKKEEYLLIPRYKGTYLIPSIAFTYFDPVKEKYETIRSEPLELKVLEGPENIYKNQSSNGLSNSNSKQNVNVLSSDILFIKTNNPQFTKEGEPFYGSTLFYLFAIAGLMGLSIPWLVFGVGKKLKGIDSSEKSGLDRAIKNALKQADFAKVNNDPSGLLEHTNLALMLTIEKVTGLNKMDLNKDQILSSLAQNNFDEKIIEESSLLISKIEMLRFAPLQKAEEEQLLKDTKMIIQKLNG